MEQPRTSFNVDSTPLLASEGGPESKKVEKRFGKFDPNKTSFTRKKQIGFVLSIILFVAISLNDVHGEDEKETKKFVKVNEMLAILSVMVCWWLAEVVNVYVTSMIPILLFPAFSIKSTKETAGRYMSDLSWLFIAAFSLAAAMKSVNLHKRLALFLLRLFGTKPLGILLGFATPAFCLSLFMSNTGTTALLIPLADGVIEATLGSLKDDEELKNAVIHFSKGVTLAIGYSATIGGSGTLVATAPNGVLLDFVQKDFNYTIPFGKWMLAFIPMGLCLLAANVTILYNMYVKKAMLKVNFSMDAINEEYKKLGKMKFDECVVAMCFVTAVLLVVFGDIAVGNTHGYCEKCENEALLRLFNNSSMNCNDIVKKDVCETVRGRWKKYFGTGSFFLFGAFPLFIIPSKLRPGETLLEWKAARKNIPWGLIILIGGGLAVAEGFKSTETSKFLASYLQGLAHVNQSIAVFILVGSVSFLTEVTSNTATTSILVPILFELATQNQLHPLKFGFSVCLGANLAFMLPIATGPNGVMYGTNKFDGFFGYARPGFLVNVCGIIIASTFILMVASPIFKLDVSYDDMDEQWKK